VRSVPADLATERVAAALADGWRLGGASMDGASMDGASMEYVPAGAGGYHWKVTGADGRARFVTVDDLDDKDWLGDTRDGVFAGLEQALSTAAALRDEAGLDFVVAPVAARGGEVVRRVDDRYAVSVFPFLDGRSHSFGPFPDARLRSRALDMIAALHRSAPAIRGRAPRHVPVVCGRGDLDAFLSEPGRRWDSGPFSEATRRLLVPRAADLARLAAGFDRLAELTAPARADPVITHGEPHPANLMSVNGRLVLIDWDTVGLGPPERDLALIAADGEDLGRYQQATGRRPDPAVLTFYRLRWYLDDLASAVRMFRNRHRDTRDTRLWRDGLAPRLDQLPRWFDLLGQTENAHNGHGTPPPRSGATR
jgi:spectinomycin phosphotransferase